MIYFHTWNNVHFLTINYEQMLCSLWITVLLISSRTLPETCLRLEVSSNVPSEIIGEKYQKVRGSILYLNWSLEVGVCEELANRFMCLLCWWREFIACAVCIHFSPSSVNPHGSAEHQFHKGSAFWQAFPCTHNLIAQAVGSMASMKCGQFSSLLKDKNHT